MIFLGNYKEYGMKECPSIKECISDQVFFGKEKIVQYLTNGHVHLTSPGYDYDVITEERIEIDKTHMDDGKYAWPSSLAYYVEKYNLRLDKEFEEYVLSK